MEGIIKGRLFNYRRKSIQGYYDYRRGDYNMYKCYHYKYILRTGAFVISMLLVFMIIFAGKINAFAENTTGEVLKPITGLTVDVDYESTRVALSWDAPYKYYSVDIYRSAGNTSNFTKLDTYTKSEYSYNYLDNAFYDYDIKKGVPYYYKLVVVEYSTVEEVYDDWWGEYYTYTYTHSGTSTPVITGKCMISLDIPDLLSVEAGNNRSITIRWMDVSGADGYRIYRKKGKTGAYSLIKTMKADAFYMKSTDYWGYTYKSSDTHEYTQQKLPLGATFYYKVCAYSEEGGKKFNNDFSSEFNAQVTINKAIINKSSSPKKGTNVIKWKKVSGASGYIVYGTSNPNGKYKKLKTLSKNKTSFTHKKVTNGKAYYYKVVAYKKYGKTKLKSTSDVYTKYCSYFGYNAESYEDRCKRIFGKSYYASYTSAAQASAHMTTISIKVWDINSSGQKYTRTMYLQVNKKIAPTVKQMFAEIYQSKERIPIHSIGGFGWRGGRSEHNEGLAIDINPVENYMIDGNTVKAGSFWNPKKSAYSIPLNCDMVKIMEKYGFYRGFWGYRKDYMHFSYFGT